MATTQPANNTGNNPAAQAYVNQAASTLQRVQASCYDAIDQLLPGNRLPATMMAVQLAASVTGPLLNALAIVQSGNPSAASMCATAKQAIDTYDAKSVEIRTTITNCSQAPATHQGLSGSYLCTMQYALGYRYGKSCPNCAAYETDRKGVDHLAMLIDLGVSAIRATQNAVNVRRPASTSTYAHVMVQQMSPVRARASGVGQSAPVFYWARAYEDVAWGNGTRTVDWQTVYEGFDYSAMLTAIEPHVTIGEWIILDSQIVGNATWEPRVILNKPYEVGTGDVLPPAAPSLPTGVAPQALAATKRDYTGPIILSIVAIGATALTALAIRHQRSTSTSGAQENPSVPRDSFLKWTKHTAFRWTAIGKDYGASTPRVMHYQTKQIDLETILITYWITGEHPQRLAELNSVTTTPVTMNDAKRWVDNYHAKLIRTFVTKGGHRFGYGHP